MKANVILAAACLFIASCKHRADSENVQGSAVKADVRNNASVVLQDGKYCTSGGQQLVCTDILKTGPSSYAYDGVTLDCNDDGFCKRADLPWGIKILSETSYDVQGGLGEPFIFSLSGACVFTCADQSTHCAIGPGNDCTPQDVGNLFKTAGKPFPRCLSGAPLKFRAGAACDMGGSGSGTGDPAITLKNGKYCTSGGQQLVCNDILKTGPSSYVYDGVNLDCNDDGFCTRANLPWGIKILSETSFDVQGGLGEPFIFSLSGACVFTCADQSTHCAIGPGDRCTPQDVGNLFKTAGKPFPKCLSGAPLQFRENQLCN